MEEENRVNTELQSFLKVRIQVSDLIHLKPVFSDTFIYLFISFYKN